jgi:predicted amidohydrolase YtcJ
MTKPFTTCLLFTLLSLGILAQPSPGPAARPRAVAAPAPEAADLVLTHGAVYTVNPRQPWATAVAVRDGRIVYVGSDKGARPYTGPRTRTIDLKGRMVLPGFIDSHLHPSGGLSLSQVKLEQVFNKGEVARRIGAYAAANPQAPWVLGRGWEAGAFKPSGIPDRHLLDSLVPDRPAFLSASDGHTGWANSKALALAGITRATPDPANGMVGKDAAGEPNGVLYESAIDLLARHVPRPTPADRLQGNRLFLAALREAGITGIMDAGAGADTDSAFAALARAGELTARMVICQRYDAGGNDSLQVARFVARRDQLGPGNPRATAIKIMLDGIIEQYTGRLVEPYLDRPGFRGPLFVEEARLHKLVGDLDRLGFQLHFHTIGDGAVRAALDALEAAQRANGVRDSRHIISHVQLIDPADIARLPKLGVIASMTPAWSRGDDLNRAFAEPRLGPERSRWLYPHRSILDAGGRLAWGTDWPVTTLVPLQGIETAVTRRYNGGLDPEGKPDAAWIPQECLSLEQAIAAYTLGAAHALFLERERGSVETGKRADLVVLEKNLFKVPVLEIHSVPVDYTIVEGKVVYERKAAGK